MNIDDIQIKNGPHEKHQQMLLDHQLKKQERRQKHHEWKHRRYKKAIPLYCLH